MTVTESGVNRARVAEIAAREEASYRQRTRRSAELFERAGRSMPLGVASSFQAYDPYPLFMTDARGSRITDADGNEFIDFDMAFGVLAAGHSHPLLAEALQYRVANGTCYTFPVEEGIALAEEIKARFGADLVRFSNSGTESTMDAIRVARGYTGREKIIKMEGGYHGHHDDVLVSIQPPREVMGPVEQPATVPASAGIPRSRIAETVIAPFNEPEMLERILQAHAGEIAAILVEPVQFNIGVVPPKDGYLQRLRELADEHGIVLIFDEVKTGVVLAWGGAYEHYGVQPDLFCLAKSIGGGIPIGAFGGKREVMASIETLEGTPAFRADASGSGIERSTIPGGATRVAHLGTFNGNPLSMTAGLVTLTRILTKDAYPRLHALADRLTAGSQAVLDEYGLPGHAINVGPKGCVMFTPGRVTNYRDFIGLDSELWGASFFYLAN
ncbi:MAG TPA: aminotransferase class III-fold pyridoxal phosphate-dependent enzyme, partial [Candidatus Limnocylindria bacterium]|nr:aminotransferase class III-fold pyridoxal phosphate-dependent enzyme [Candidatus Limnocylindria bacterium]